MGNYRVLIASRSFGKATPDVFDRLKGLGAEVVLNPLERAPTEADMVALIKDVDVLTFPIQTATQTGLAATLNNVYVYGLPKDYPESFRAKIAAVTSAQVKTASSTLLGSEQSVIAIVGDYAKVKDQLAAYKDITFLDTDGKVIAPPR